MKTFRQLLDFFLYSNIFISVCAAALTVETYLLVHAEINWPYIAFVFVATLALYNFPLIVENNFSPDQPGRHTWISKNKKLLITLFVTAFAATGTLVLFFSLKFILWFIPVAMLAFAYFFPQTQLRGIAGLKTVIVAFVWTCVSAVFPLLIISDFDLHYCFINMNGIILLQNFLFILPLSIIFNVRDIEADRKAGVRTIPVIYGVKITILICLILLALFSVLVAFSPYLRECRVGLLLSATATATLLLSASEKRSEYYYSLWVDGMIIFQAEAICLLNIFY